MNREKSLIGLLNLFGGEMERRVGRRYEQVSITRANIQMYFSEALGGSISITLLD